MKKIALTLLTLALLLLVSCDGAGDGKGTEDTSNAADHTAACVHEESFEVKENDTAPTCDTVGGYDQVIYCKTCQKKLSSEHVTLVATGHTAGQSRTENEILPECTREGSYESVVTCTVCQKEIFRTTQAVPAKGHTATAPVQIPVTPATCTSDGTAEEVIECTMCGEELSRTSVTLPAAHTMENGTCTVCARQESTEGLLFFLNPDQKSYMLSRVLSECTETDIVVDLYQGLPVTHVASLLGGSAPITSVVLGADVARVDERALHGCSELRTLTLRTAPDVCLFFGNNVLEGCTSLSRLSVDSLDTYCNMFFQAPHPLSFADELYVGGTPLTEATVPEGIPSIPNYTFSCKSLARVTIPTSVKSIDYGAFLGCTALTEVKIHEGVKQIAMNAFAGCTSLSTLVIPDSVTEIEEFALGGCTAIEHLTLPLLSTQQHSSYATTLRSLFQKDDRDYETGVPASLSSITFTALPRLGSSMLAGATGLCEVILPETLTAIDDRAFENCTALERLTLPSSLKKLTNTAFLGCTALKELYVLDLSVLLGMELSIDSYTGDIYPFHDRTVYCGGEALTSLVIPEGTTSIGRILAGYTALTSVTLPASMTAVNDKAFENCTALTSVTLAATTESIGARAFAGCTALTTVTLPASLTSIGSAAFRDTALTAVYFEDAAYWSIPWAISAYTYVFPTEQISDAAIAASYLAKEYVTAPWTKIDENTEITLPPEMRG